MQITDSHCHLDKIDLSIFNNSMDNVLSEANQLSVKHFLCACIDLENFPKVLELAKKYPQIYASVGVHPTHKNGKEVSADELIKLANNNKIIAIGETGLDYFHIVKDDANWQRQRFRTHIQASNKTNKPLIIHTRNAIEDTFKIMQEEKAQAGVMHCFAEDWKSAKIALDMGFYISFSGIVTFKNAINLQEVAKKAPLDRIMLETDAPYLAPVPYRGKPNSPAYTYFIAEKLAEIREDSIENIAKHTTNNFNTLFKINT